MSATQTQVESKASPAQSVRFSSSSNLNDLESASPTPTYNSHSNTPIPGPTTLTQISALRKYTLLIVFCLAQFVDVFNISALFSAIPVMSEELDIDAGQSAWIISALQLTFAAFLLASGRISDIYNPKTAFVVGLLGVGIIPLIIGFIRDKIALFVLRAFTGIFSALTIPSALRLIVLLFHEPVEQSRAIGVFGGCGAIGNVFGVVIGAVLVELASWPWVFWFATLLATPAAIIAFLLIPPKEEQNRSLRVSHEGEKHQIPSDISSSKSNSNNSSSKSKPESESASKIRQLDLFGVTVLTIALVLFIFALTSTSTAGWKSGEVLAPLIISIFMVVGFFYWETVIEEGCALVPPKTWFYPNFSVLFALALLPYLWWTNIFLTFITYWQSVYGWSIILTAVHMLPLGLTAFVATNTGPLSNIYKPKWIIVGGLGMMVGASVLLPFGSEKDRYWSIIFPAFLVGSAGCALVYTHANIAMFRTTPPSVSGTIGAIFNSALQLGSAVGTAIVTSIQTSVDPAPISSSAGSTNDSSSSSSSSSSTTVTVAPGFKGRAAGFWFLFAIVVVELIAVLVFYRPEKRAGDEGQDDLEGAQGRRSTQGHRHGSAQGQAREGNVHGDDEKRQSSTSSSGENTTIEEIPVDLDMDLDMDMDLEKQEESRTSTRRPSVCSSLRCESKCETVVGAVDEEEEKMKEIGSRSPSPISRP